MTTSLLAAIDSFNARVAAEFEQTLATQREAETRLLQAVAYLAAITRDR